MPGFHLGSETRVKNYLRLFSTVSQTQRVAYIYVYLKKILYIFNAVLTYALRAIKTIRLEWECIEPMKINVERRELVLLAEELCWIAAVRGTVIVYTTTTTTTIAPPPSLHFPFLSVVEFLLAFITAFVFCSHIIRYYEKQTIKICLCSHPLHKYFLVYHTRVAIIHGVQSNYE